MIVRSLIAGSVLLAGLAVAVAQGDPIAQRKEMMKAVGGVTRDAAAMVKGEAPFDLAKAQRTFTVYADTARKFGGLFPDSSKTGGDTTAAPKIWEDMAGFKAGLAKWEKESTDAAAAVKDLDSLKAAFGNVAKNCGACHETYRIKKS
jgi:cytochrome c556